MTYRPPRAYRIGRNGMPEPAGYVYRGTGTDQMPHILPEDLKPYEGPVEQYLPDFARGNNRPRRNTDRCGRCGYLASSQNCRIQCGAR